MIEKPDPPTLAFASRAEWERWLEANHGEDAGIWMVIAKKGSGIRSLTHEQALETALAFGWIDGQRKALDDGRFLQRFTPRRARSRWSRRNREWAERLIAEGRMREPGLREVERAKADGRWEAAYESPSRIVVPDDLAAALAASPAALAAFEALNAQNRYAILYRLHHLKRPETRARRVAEFVAMLERGERLHP